MKGNIVGHPVGKWCLIIALNEGVCCDKIPRMCGTIIVKCDFREFVHWFCWGTFGPGDLDSCLTVYSIYRVVQALVKMIHKECQEIVSVLSLKALQVMAPMHLIYNSILCLLFHSQQHCFCTLVCSSDTDTFLEFPKECESGVRGED